MFWESTFGNFRERYFWELLGEVLFSLPKFFGKVPKPELHQISPSVASTRSTKKIPSTNANPGRNPSLHEFLANKNCSNRRPDSWLQLTKYDVYAFL